MYLWKVLISFVLTVTVTVSATSTPTAEVVKGRVVIWQIPDSPKSSLFIAHGCGSSAGIFWDESPACPNCTGLPEERRLVLNALDRGFAVLTISSRENCWSIEEGGNITLIINQWLQIHHLEHLPLSALGISSGGDFVSVLATEIHLSSITIMISAGKFDEMVVPIDYPPTLFVYMHKDTGRMRMIKNSIKILRQKGIPVKKVSCMDFPLTPNLFSERIPGLNLTTSLQLYELFRKEGFTNGNNYLKADWMKSWERVVSKGEIVSKLDQILEELNLAYALHETTSLQSDSIFDWFRYYLC